MKISYGIDVQESNDPYVLVAEEASKGVSEAGVPGAFWVDVFPVLKYVPSWFPGAGFQKKAAHWRKVNKSMIEKPFRYVKEQLVRGQFFELVQTMTLRQKNGSVAHSMASGLIERLPSENDPQRAMEEKIAQDVPAISFIGRWCCEWTINRLLSSVRWI